MTHPDLVTTVECSCRHCVSLRQWAAVILDEHRQKGESPGAVFRDWVQQGNGILYRVRALQDLPRGMLSSYERNFVYDVPRDYTSDHQLSRRQVNYARKLWRDYADQL